MSRKVLLIGWDAADWRIIDPLLDQGKMPNLQRLIENGVRGNLASIEPILSPMLWTTIATGKRAYKHGVHGFSEPDPVSGGIRPVTNLSRKTKAIWNILNQQGKDSIVVGWWPSHPVEPLSRGVMVSNHYQRASGKTLKDWRMQPGTVHPKRLEQVLSQVRLHPSELAEDVLFTFLPALAEMDQVQLDKIREHGRLKSVMQIIADCTTVHSAATALMQNEPWDFAGVYFDAIDHFGHGFMKFHPPRLDWIAEDEFAIWKDVVESGYRFHDMMLGTLMAQAGEDATIMICSDHGFHPDHMRPREIPREPAGPAHEHRHLGMFAAMGPGIRKDALVHGACLLDICPTLLHGFGLPVGEDMDGRVLTDIWEAPQTPRRIPSWDRVDGDDGQHPPDMQISAADSKAAMDQLVALGYVEAPDADQHKAVENTVRELDYNLACAYIDGGVFTEAILLLERLYAQWPMEHRFGAKLRLCYQNLGRVADLRRSTDTLIQRRLEEAKEAAREVESLGLNDPDKQAAERARIESLDEKERAKVAREREHLLGKARPNLHALNYLSAYADMFEKNYATALAKLEQLDTDFGARRNAISLRGDIHLRQRDWDKAREAYGQALEIDAEMPGPHLGLARAALGRRDYPTAVQHARRAIGFGYQAPRAHYLLGLACYRAGDWQQAGRAFLTAARQAPLMAKTYRMLGEIARYYRHDLTTAAEYRLLALQARKRLAAERKGQRAAAQAVTAEDSRLPALLPRTEKLDGIAESEIITIVTGLPRSGTSLMMQMLEAAGIPAFTDNQRAADASNPRGYYEQRDVAALLNKDKDRRWVHEARGHALKVVAPLLGALPLHRGKSAADVKPTHYRVLFMERDMHEILDSQRQMLERKGSDKARHDERADPARAYRQQIKAARAWLARHGIAALSVDYNALVAEPGGQIPALSAFLGRPDADAIMAAVVDPALYRSRAYMGSE